tara:strand:- start:6766 stop:9282 length:2517 start_codon:yes stop_codon:yes gene_type:complete
MKSNTSYLFLKKPVVAGFLSFIILLFITQYVAYQKYLINTNEKQKEINSQVNLIKEKLQTLIQFSYSATKTLQYIVEKNGIPSDFDSIANDLIVRNKYFDVVELVDGNGIITHVYPLKDNQVLGFNILTSSTASSGALATIKRKDFFIAGPVHLKQGGVGIISRQPIFIEGKFAGFSAVVTKLSTFLNDLNINTSNDNRFFYQLSRVNLETGKEEFFLENDVSSFKEFAIPIKMAFGEWKLYVVPAKPHVFNSAIWFALLGLMISILGGWAVWFFAGRPMRLNKQINIKLIEQESQLKLIYETTQEEIKKSESNLNKAQQIANLGSWELDVELNKLNWSNEMFRIFEKDPKKFEVSREAFLDAIHPEDREMVINTCENSVKNKKPYQLTYRLKFEKDRIKYVNEQCETVYDENQKPKKSFGTIQDVTDRKEAEEILKNSELLYRSLASNAPVAIFNTDKTGACNYVNEEWLKYSGMSFTEAMGFGWRKALYPEDKERVMNEWQQAILSKTEFHSELRFQAKNGNITWLSVKATKLLDANNNLYGYIGMATDITDRIKNEEELLIYKNNLEKLVKLRTEELDNSKEALLNLLEDLNIQSVELEQAKIEAQSANKTKSAFLATMSHELRTPLNSIIGFTSILLKGFAGPLNDEQEKQLGMVKNSGQHLLTLINDILDISKIEAGELIIENELFNYSDSIEQIVSIVNPLADKKNLNITITINSSPIKITSDKRRVEQVLLNLLTNAIKFTKQGEIHIEVSLQDDKILTKVIDTGIGISKEDIPNLFIPFSQLDNKLTRQQEGTGLGLSICNTLLEKLNGSIYVESKLGKGSSFCFYLPYN